MASLLESLRPLHALTCQASDPKSLCAHLVHEALGGGDGPAILRRLRANVVDRKLAQSNLRFAGVLDESGTLTPNAPLRLAQLQVMIEMTSADSWELVLTVPDFLREALNAMVDSHGVAARPRETIAALTEVVSEARHCLVIAAPFFHIEFLENLLKPIERLLRDGGDVVVITRAVDHGAADQSRANAAAVAGLRKAADGHAGRLTVHSWNLPGLGIHFKVAVADAHLAYVGSANMTPGGLAGHAEAGVLLRGARAAEVARWLTIVGQELSRLSRETEPTSAASVATTTR